MVDIYLHLKYNHIMKLKIKNVGKIANNNEPIIFDGITVLAGKNDTGKSTISKVLYCIFSSLFDIDTKINNMRKNEIANSINVWDWFSSESPLVDSILLKNDKRQISQILQDYRISILEEEDIEYDGINYGNKNNPNYEAIRKKSDDESELLYNIIIKKKDYFLNSIVERKFLDEFLGQINNLYNNDDCEISLDLKNNFFNFCFRNNKLVDIQLPPERIKHQIIYFDGPNIFDSNRRLPGRTLTHKSDYYYKVFSKNDFNNIKYNNIINKYQNVFKLLLKYKFTINEYNRVASVKLEGTSMSINASLLSNGSKTIALLHNLFLTDFLDYENLLILDEPEVNLHPEWQVLLAEILVILQKEFSLTLLISTHSPYFLNAIDTFSYKYGVNTNCKYYFAEIDKNLQSKFTNMSNSVDELYNELAIPFEKLELERGKLLDD